MFRAQCLGYELRHEPLRKGGQRGSHRSMERLPWCRKGPPSPGDPPEYRWEGAGRGGSWVGTSRRRRGRRRSQATWATSEGTWGGRTRDRGRTGPDRQGVSPVGRDSGPSAREGGQGSPRVHRGLKDSGAATRHGARISARVARDSLPPVPTPPLFLGLTSTVDGSKDVGMLNVELFRIESLGLLYIITQPLLICVLKDLWNIETYGYVWHQFNFIYVSNKRYSRY